ncbi:ribosomal protein S18-alanine N-acetyltransferase [Desulforhopalus singaporensis]|uniref:[Ribosomal protein bS18]-alanine N-acetyltransferase n=1 Tax=Desulforhopalus singaporensis TaxID=91360 RepID=A0A1H0SDB7_9BACT|nr:ribosomal protein S18-alanine N-acetyltransferase [Desulforhopalus singaporensis]SDP39792.1 ribosomal-protein-alanine N-acetyltransferase [Desulforhopalus singaporensis]
MRIRRLTTVDLPQLAEIESQTRSPWPVAELTDELQQGRDYVYVAESLEGDRAEIEGWYKAQVVPPEAELHKIAVLRAVRRQGIGQKLLDHLIGKLVKEGCSVLYLEVRSKNNQAVGFYRKNGFYEVGLRRGYYREPVDDALLMQRDITQPGIS